MAEDDEIDILGDFSFNSCFAQNNQGIPSCSNREDTVHPQWLLDSPAANWYDIKNINRSKEGPSRKLSGTKSCKRNKNEVRHTTWSQEERDMLKKEMEKHGRNVKKISKMLTSKTTTEIQALIEVEHGINLDSTVWDKNDSQDHIPYVGQEEIVTDEVTSMSDVITMVTTGSTTVSLPKVFRTKSHHQQGDFGAVNPMASKNKSATVPQLELKANSFSNHKEKMKATKKLGNHRRKISRNYDQGRVRNRSKDMKSPQGRQRNDSSLSEDSVKSPKLQIVLGSGQALPISEGEQVIKIEKKKDSEQESDIEIDVDSDTEDSPKKCTYNKTADYTKPPLRQGIEEDNAPIAVPLRKLEMPRRRRKINLNGGGGYRILHTEAGDVYEVSSEPRKERQVRKPTVQLIQCRTYGIDKPAPCEVQLHVSVLLSMDIHAHTSRAEVMGLVGGRQAGAGLLLCAYRVARAAANSTHCDMDPVSQAAAGEQLRALGLSVCGWHHSHPHFPALPSGRDLHTQRALQAALEWRLPFLALLTSQHSAPAAPHFRCFRVEETEEEAETPAGYQLDVELVADLTAESLPEYVRGLRELLLGVERTEHSIDLARDVCPQTGISYLNKCIWSVSRHMRAAGYEAEHPVLKDLIQSVRDIFR